MDDPALSWAIEVARGQVASMLNPAFDAQSYKDTANTLATFIVDTWDLTPVNRADGIKTLGMLLATSKPNARSVAGLMIEETTFQRKLT